MILGYSYVREGVEEGGVKATEVDYLFCYYILDFLWIFCREMISKVSYLVKE